MLVDELASGTDPAEGSALGQAVVSELARRVRLTVVTTHYPELKEWASATTVAANAATGIDPVTHAPLYRIVLGRPGSSHALRTAGRLGLAASIVADARAASRPSGCGSPTPRRDGGRGTVGGGRARSGRGRAREAAASQSTRAGAPASSRRIREVRASSARARELALAEAERDLAEARAELRALREEIRVARRREKRPGAHRPRARRAERDRDRHLAAASARAASAEERCARSTNRRRCWRRSASAIPS